MGITTDCMSGLLWMRTVTHTMGLTLYELLLPLRRPRIFTCDKIISTL